MAILQIQAFHRREFQSFLNGVVRRVIDKPHKQASGTVDIKNVQAARILLEGSEALQADAEGTGEDDAVHAAVRDDE